VPLCLRLRPVCDSIKAFLAVGPLAGLEPMCNRYALLVQARVGIITIIIITIIASGIITRMAGH
jgi:hypothetical protein